MIVHVMAFRALADPRRLEIVEFLRDGERSVSEIVEHVGIDQSGVSRHLHKLLEARVVEARRDGQRRMYRLLPDPLQELAAWAERFRSLWDARLDRLDDHIAKRRSQP